MLLIMLALYAPKLGNAKNDIRARIAPLARPSSKLLLPTSFQTKHHFVESNPDHLDARARATTAVV